MSRGLALVLLLGLPALGVQLALPVPRLDADAVEYYSHLRSLYFDHDLDFANEFEHFGILSRYDKIRPTPTGHRRTIFSVGPALLWLPFYAAGDLVARARGEVLDGYSPAHIRAVCLGSLALALCGLWVLERPLRELLPNGPVALTLGSLFFGTFLWWYAAYEPVMSHTGSFCLAAIVVAVFWPGRDGLTRARALALGLLIGVAATVRWQNGVLMLLPGLVLGRQLLGHIRGRAPAQALRTTVTGLLSLAAFCLGVLPQLLAWKAIFGQYLLADPPHGRDFLRLGHPFFWETFFSSRHGLFYWTPLLWLGYLGFWLLLRRERRTACVLLVPLALMTYVNVCSGDWWAGGSFSNRRFDSLLPLLALGLGLTLDLLERLVRRYPIRFLSAVGLVFVLWNGLFMQQYRLNLIPRDDTVAFPEVAANNAALLQAAVGTPLAWPANWIFAWRHRLPVAQYDRLVGQYLFYRQNNLGGVIELGDDRIDAPFLDEFWSSPRPCGDGQSCRSVLGSARIFAPLDAPEWLELDVVASGRGSLSVAVNDVPLGALPLDERLQGLSLALPAQALRRELNELRFTVPADSAAWVDRLVFRRQDGQR